MIRFKRSDNKLRVDRSGKAATINLINDELLLDDKTVICNRINWYKNGCDYYDFLNAFGLDDNMTCQKLYLSFNRETRKLIRNFGVDMIPIINA